MTQVRDTDEARKCTILREDGRATSLGEVLDRQDRGIKRTMIIFIRHFFCGNCQEYIRRLKTDLAPSSLPNDLSIIVIGCGAPTHISSYQQLTSCPYPIYADPSIRLYKVFGMQRSLSLGSRGPAYIQHSLASGMVRSIVQGLKRIPAGDVMQAGNFDVNGGEFLFERYVDSSSESQNRASWCISWSHCMMNSRDHAEIETLREVLALNHSSATSRILSERPSRSISTNRESRISIRRSLSLRRRSWMVRTSHGAQPTLMKDMVHAA